MSAPSRSWRRRRAAVAAALAGASVLGWLAAGIRTLDPRDQFGILQGAWGGGARSIEDRRFVLAPPGLTRLTIFPKGARTITLPDASAAMLPSADGSRYGLKGTASLRADPARPAALAGAAGGTGLDGVMLSAVRAAAPILADALAGERAVPTRVAAFEGALRRALEERGVAIEALDLRGFDYLAASAGVAPVPAGVRVLVVGLDGADWEIVDPLMAAGRMPNLARLVAGGVRAKLLTITPTLSPVVWTSIATGVEPVRHGILDFLVSDAGGGSEPVSSGSRLAPAIWELLSAAGVPVAVTGWWATWPADRVRGTMVTDRVAYQLFGYRSDARAADGKTWPPALYEAIRPRIVPPDAVAWTDVVPYLSGSRLRPEQFDPDERKLLDEFRTLLASGRTYLAAAEEQRRAGDPRFEAVYFEGTDTVGHLFMPYRRPRLPEVDPRRFESFCEVVDRYYETADAMLGKLLVGREGWTVIVLSDHGFACDATRPRTTDSRIGHGAAADWHRRFGILVLSGAGTRRGVRLEEASVYDVAPTILALFGQPVPRSWPGRVLGAALDPEILADRPVRFRVDDPVRAAGAARAGEAPPGDADSQALREKLQSLGYVAASAPAPMTTANNRGVALLADGKYGEAAAEFRRAIAEEPDQPTLWVNLGIALRFSGKTEDAEREFLRALASPGAARAAGHQLAQLLMDRGDLAGAERRLREVLAREPGAAEVRNSLGLVLEARGDPAGARREYEEAARLDANAAEPRNNLGNLDKNAGRSEEAERRYLEAIAADPYFMGSYNNLALLYQDRGDAGKAIELYGRALAKAPTNAIVMNNLASLYFTAGDNATARAYWEKAVAADPAYPSPLNNLAGLALAEGRLDDADALLARALALDPSYGDAHMNRALLATRRADTAGARSELEAACRDPRSEIAAKVQLGLLELGAGRPRAAADALEAARRRGGNRVDVLNPLGEAYARLGERSRALESWRTSLKIKPDQGGVGEAVRKLEKLN